MVSELSRRNVLGASALTGLVGGAAFLPPRWLPPWLAVQRARLRPVPAVDARPPVSDGHADAARAALAEAVERAERAVDGVEAGDDPPAGVRPQSAAESAASYLERARSADGWDALFAVGLGMERAGHAIGGVRVLTGEASGEFLASRALDIQERVAGVRDEIAHEVDAPSRGLARLYWVERWLASAGLNSYRDGTYLGQDEPTTEYEPYDVVQTWGSHFRARRDVADAERLRADYRGGLDDPRSLAAHVERAAADLQAEARRRVPDHEAVRERSAELEALAASPYRTLRRGLLAARRNADVRTGEGPWAGLPLYRAVGNAEAVLTCRGATYAREHAALDPRGTVRATDLANAKREGLALLRERRRAARDRPVLELLLREGRRLLWAGDAELEGDADVEYPRARAYGTYLRAVGYLRALPDVAARIDRPDAG